MSAPAGSALILTRRLTLVAVAPSQLACFDLHEELPPSLPSWLVLSRRTVAQDDRLRALWALLVAEPEPDVAAPLATAFVRLAARHANTAPQVADPLVRRALEIALGDLARRWTVPELARRVGLSRAAFCRRFRAAAGAPPERALTELRMRRAAELLATTELGLAAIAAQVGRVRARPRPRLQALGRRRAGALSRPQRRPHHRFGCVAHCLVMSIW